MAKNGLKSVGKFKVGQEIVLFHQPEVKDPQNPQIIRQYETRVGFVIHTFPDEAKAICYQQTAGGMNQYFAITVRDIQKIDAMGSYEERMDKFNRVANFNIQNCSCGMPLDMDTEVLAGYDTCIECLTIEGRADELAERGVSVGDKVSYEERLMSLHYRVRNLMAQMSGHGSTESF